uniref:Uncharacterized protein n=1 Tax=viral metagenome TaxID=1070528 RepID=A0A6M3KIV4_9ZZZZ
MLKMEIISKVRDIFGIWEVTVLLNKKEYTYPIISEYALKKVERLLRNRKPGKALHVLKLFTTSGFNVYREK